MDKSREQFEKWLEKYHGLKAGDLNYANMIEMYWQAWQASRVVIEVELPPVCDAHSDDIDKGYDICHYRTQECLKNQGIKFKIEGAERWSKIATPLESK